MLYNACSALRYVDDVNHTPFLRREAVAPRDPESNQEFFRRPEEFKRAHDSGTDEVALSRQCHFMSAIQHDQGWRYASRRHSICRAANEAQRMLLDIPKNTEI